MPAQPRSSAAFPPGDELTLEINILCLAGIQVGDHDDDGDHDGLGTAPAATATVAFGGSVDGAKMAVGSSTLCGYTGQPVVESEEIGAAPGAPGGPGRDRTAVWRDGAAGRRGGSHLRLSLRRRNPGLPAAPLPSVNRDSRLIYRSTILNGGDRGTGVTAVSALNIAEHTGDSAPDTPHQRPGTTDSLLWTRDSQDTLPDIVELVVRLRSKDPNFADQIGVAHLVVFGHEEDHQRTYVLDLPVKKPSPETGYQASDDSRPPVLLLGPDAHLRVQVASVPSHWNSRNDGDEAAPRLTSLSSESSASLAYSWTELEENLEDILEKYRAKDRTGMNSVKLQQRPLQTDVPVRTRSESSQLNTCGTLWPVHQFFLTIKSVIVPCDKGAFAGSDMSDDSSIATRDSMRL